MAASNAFAAAGTTVSRGQVGGGAGQAYTPVGEIVDIDGPNLSSSFIDVTHMLSPNNTREFIASLKDSGSVRLSMNYVPNDAGQNPTTGFLYDRENSIKRWYKIDFTDGNTTTVEFQAFVEEFSISAKMGDKGTAQVGLKISGPLTWS